MSIVHVLNIFGKRNLKSNLFDPYEPETVLFDPSELNSCYIYITYILYIYIVFRDSPFSDFSHLNHIDHLAII